MRKRTITPQEQRLLDRIEKEQMTFERNYARLKRAFNRMDKAVGTIRRARNQLSTVNLDKT